MSEQEHSHDAGKKLKQKILLPLLGVFCLLVIAFSVFIYQNERLHLNNSFVREMAEIQASYSAIIHQRDDSLRTALAFLERDQTLRKALAAGNRTQLQIQFAPLFEQLKREFRITHFYLLDASRVTLLRLHQPDRFDDRIERFTAREAERTGRIASGTEIGPLGTITLRAVAPLFESGKAIGYVEVGMEVADIFKNTIHNHGDDVYVLLHQELLSRKDWEQGMRMLGRTPEWDRYPGFVVSSQTRADIPAELDQVFAQGGSVHKREETVLKEGNLTYRLGFLPLADASGRDVGHIAVLHNTTAITAQSRQMMQIFTGVVVGCGILLLVVISLVLGRTQRVLATYLDERQKAEGEIESLAFYDPLTRLPNRRLLLDRFKHALAASARNGRQGALLFVGLDNFKVINDTLGHDTGDLLLQEVALRTDACTRGDDTVSRFSGDEFVVLLEGLSEQELEAAAQAESIGEKILAALGEPYQLGKHECHSTASIGATLFIGYKEGMDELLKQADIAMLQAKKAGRNTLRFFDPTMQAAITGRVAMESDLRRATFSEGQLLLYYQPQVDSSGCWIGAEALVRWRHPERGMISPAEFIPLAEETGLILPLGHWVLSTACKQLVAWAQHPETSHLVLAVNISAKQFQLPTFVEEVLSLVEYFKVDPAKLKLEITESTVLGNVEDVIAKMTELKNCGLSFSMDDFGTGYSSLSLLKRLPLHQLKIDQSFVRDILVDSSDAAISRMIVNLAQSMGLSVIAEGVETDAQREFLGQSGCHAYQGYLFGKPVPVEEFEALLKQG